MRKFIKTFVLHGLVAAGFGPLILVSVYYSYQLAGKITSLPVSELNGNILSALLLAFIAGGISAIFKVEKIPLGIATLIDAVVLYVDYLFFYLINNWIEKRPIPLLVFTIIFVIGYLIVWAIIYKQVKNQVQKINQKL